MQLPASVSRPLYAGRHLPSNQASDRFIPERVLTAGFDDICLFHDAWSKGLLSFVSRTHTCHEFSSRFTSTLTTTAFDRSSLKWFETCS
jgi:hypothetical protein